MLMMMKLQYLLQVADLSFDLSLIRSTGILLYCHIKYARRKNRCVFHDDVYQLINPNITSSHLKRNSKTSFLQFKIFFVLKYFIWSQFSSVYFTPYQFHATYHITTIKFHLPFSFVLYLYASYFVPF